VRSRNQELGLSDALGAIVLVAVVGMGIALVGVFIFSQPIPDKIPALAADITPIGNTIMITHNGGDTLQRSETMIVIDGQDETANFTRFGSGSAWDTFAVGDMLVYTIQDDKIPEGVTLYYIGGTSAHILMSIGVPQSVPGGSPATPTPSTTTTPVPTDPVFADFTASPVTGLAPLSVQFADASTGPVTSWLWSFGDSGTSALQNPVHQYLATGDYSVSLTVGNGTGTNTLTKTNYINVTHYAPGLLANYFSDQAWSVPAITKIADRIRYADAESGYDSDLANWPLDYIGKTNDFSVSFDGYLYVPADDTYTFYLTSDDGSYLSLDGVQVINNGGDHPPEMQQVTRPLTTGYHPIQVRMYENGGGAVVYLEYSTPTVARTFVTSLYHTPNTPPFSDFTATPRVGNAPLAVQFTDTSVDASSWSWDFGDGSPVSHAQNPQHTYASGGSYTVTLTTTNAIGSNAVSKPNYIVIGSLDPGFSASYYYDQGWTNLAGTRIDNRIRFADDQGSTTYGTDEVNWPTSMIGGMEDFSVSWDGFLNVPTGETYTFYLTSDDGSWLWIDDIIIVDNSGLHSPEERTGTATLSAGYHAIRVRMFENTGEAVAHLEYSTPTTARTYVTDVWHLPETPPAPVAGFDASPVSGGVPLTVVFTETSTNAPTSWSWDFGDGDPTNSTAQSPVHTYAGAGTYSVSMTATNAGGSDTLTRTNYITASTAAAPVRAGFSGTPLAGTQPLAVQFSDASTGPVTSWSWTFGDGSTSSLQNPPYTYPDMGMYPVSLTVSNGTGSDTLTRADYITVGAPVTGTITLNRPTGPAYVESGSTLQFRVQPGWAAFTLDGSMQVLSSGNVVELVWGSDGYGSISSTASSINSMLDFTDVSVYVNGVLIGRGTLTSIYIASYDQYQSTIVLTMPPSADWTSLNVDGTPVPVSATDTVSIAGLGSAMNLNAQTGSIWYSGGAASYIVY
jgi:PKD repeat protein